METVAKTVRKATATRLLARRTAQFDGTRSRADVVLSSAATIMGASQPPLPKGTSDEAAAERTTIDNVSFTVSESVHSKDLKKDLSGKDDKSMDRFSAASSRPARYPRATPLLVTAGWMAFISSLLLLVSYAAPYWLESYEETRSDTQFRRLGLWEVCFSRYMHPPYQYDEVFDGCHWIHGYYYQNIRDWLMPGWFMFTQAMLTLGLIFQLLALMVLSLLLMRYLLRYEIVALTAAFVLEALTALLLFLGVSVFGGMAFSRYWILYPNFNHLGWAYAFAVVAMFFHAFTACVVLKEAFSSKERRRRDNNLVYNMQPRGEPVRY